MTNKLLSSDGAALGIGGEPDGLLKLRDLGIEISVTGEGVFL